MDVKPEKDELEELTERLGFRFSDERLLAQALVHRSYCNEHAGSAPHNERLEFLGDAVLDLVIAEALWKELPDAPEGQLTRCRAALVNEASLADLAARLEIGKSLRLGRGEEMNNGRRRASILADAVEAIAGAIFLDGGWKSTREVILSWLGTKISEVVSGDFDSDAKTDLQKRLQILGRGEMPQYRVISHSGPDHEPLFEVEIGVGDEIVGWGKGRSKKLAEKAAAREALKSLGEPAGRNRQGDEK
ncbi:MAG: ribonuclease III [Polyangia bacterium]